MLLNDVHESLTAGMNLRGKTHLVLKHPPIATALVGAGVLSLWRTTPIAVDEEDYLTAAQQRFGEQVGEAVETVKEYAAETAVAALENKLVFMQSLRGTLSRG